MGTYDSEYGCFYATSAQADSEVVVTQFQSGGRSALQGGGLMYFHNISQVTIRDSVMSACNTQRGLGGAILFDGVESIEISNSQFVENTASMGPALACIGGSSFANMSYITFLDNRVTSFEFGPDIYSDGSC